MPKPIPKSDPDTITRTFSRQEDALIARALYEAGKLNREGWDPEANEDPIVGLRMHDLLCQHFGEARDAFQRADVLREAVGLGFLPPASGDVMAAAEAYLAEVETLRKAAKSLPQIAPETPLMRRELDARELADL